MPGLNSWYDQDSVISYTNDELRIEQEELPEDLRKKRGFILAGTVLVNIIIWTLAYYLQNDVWALTINSLGQRKNIWPAFDWYFRAMAFGLNLVSRFFIALAFMFIYKKAVAIKIICLHAVNYLITWYLILGIKSKRVGFEDVPENQNQGCICVFGMPSSTTSEVTIGLLLFFYELAVKPKHISWRTKTFMKVLCFFLICNFILTKLYFGSHTTTQALTGACVACLTFSVSLLLEDYLTNYFSNFLYANFHYAAPLYTIFMLITLMNLIGLPLVMEYTVENFKGYTSKVCFVCFSNNLLEIRKFITVAFQYNSLVLGLLVGTRLLSPRVQADVEKVTNLTDHISWKGIFRIAIMLVIHLPLLIITQPLSQSANMKMFLLIYTVVYVSVGFNMSFVFTWICRKLKLEFEGDLERKRVGTGLSVSDATDVAKESWYSKAK